MADETGSEEVQSEVTQTPVITPPIPEDSMEPMVIAAVPKAEPKSKGVKPAWLIGGLATLLVLFGVVWGALGELPGVGEFPLTDPLEAWLLKAPWAKEQDIFTMIPADTGMVGWVSTGFDGEAWSKLEELWDRFPKSETWLADIKESMENDSDGVAPNWDEDFKPWIGTEVAMFMGMDELFAETGADPQMAIVTTTSNADDAIATLIKLSNYESIKTQEDAEKVSYRSEELLKLADTTYLLVLDHYAFVFSSRKMAEQVIDLYKDGGETLASNVDFVAYRESVEGMVGGLLMPSIKGYVESILGSQLKMMGTDASDTESLLRIYDGIGMMGMQVQPESDGLVIGQSMAMDFDVLADKGMTNVYESFEPVLATRLPADTAFFVEMQSAGIEKADITAQLDSLPSSLLGMASTTEMIAAFEEFTGVSLDELLSLAAGNGGLAMWSGDGVPSLSLMTEVDDAKLAMGVMDKIAKVVLAYGVSTGEVDAAGATPEELLAKYFKETTIGDVSLKSLVPPAAEAQLIPDILNVSYAVVDGYLIVSSDETGILAFMDAASKQGKTLATESEVYTTIRAKQPNEISGATMFIGRENMVQLIVNGIRAASASSGMTETDELTAKGLVNQWNSDLAPLEGLGAWAVRTEAGLESTMFVSMPE